VKKEHVAFSQPTDHGLAFAFAYTERGEIWSYC
jgi:hypothetical protein